MSLDYAADRRKAWLGLIGLGHLMATTPDTKIFGIGLPRTGTTSLDAALCRLKIRSTHFVIELYRDRNSPILDRFQAFGDTPSRCCIRNSMPDFPGTVLS